MVTFFGASLFVKMKRNKFPITLVESFASQHTCLWKRRDMGKFTDKVPTLLCYNKWTRKPPSFKRGINGRSLFGAWVGWKW